MIAVAMAADSAPRSRSDFEAELRAIGAQRYHDRHPFHILLHSGGLNQGQVQAWILNRYYYQSRIPLKDAALLAKIEDSSLRREWRSRLESHDGSDDNPGGLQRWLVLARAVGLDPDRVVALEGILPATRFAVDAYVHFVASHSTLEAIASSLTELFAATIHRNRISGLMAHYDFADQESLAYFSTRLREAPEDVRFGLAYVLDHAQSRAQQQACCAALTLKTEILWAQLDALYYAYVVPGHIPPGAFDPVGS